MPDRPYRATLLPLDGKYYGTRVRIESTDRSGGLYDQTLTLWLSDDLTPSRRELAAWDEDEMGEPWSATNQHYESATALAAAEAVVSAINGRAETERALFAAVRDGVREGADATREALAARFGKDPEALRLPR